MPLLVGKGVRMGSGGRGGPGYQALAMVLTYLAIVATYVPMIIESVKGEASNPVAIAITVVALPFLMGAKNVIGILIIGFAVYQAWIMNRRANVVFAGPFQVKASAT